MSLDGSISGLAAGQVNAPVTIHIHISMGLGEDRAAKADPNDIFRARTGRADRVRVHPADASFAGKLTIHQARSAAVDVENDPAAPHTALPHATFLLLLLGATPLCTAKSSGRHDPALHAHAPTPAGVRPPWRRQCGPNAPDSPTCLRGPTTLLALVSGTGGGPRLGPKRLRRAAAPKAARLLRSMVRGRLAPANPGRCYSEGTQAAQPLTQPNTLTQ